MDNTITYHLEKNLDPDTLLDVFIRSGLAERRPSDRDRLKMMCAYGNLVITAVQNGKVIGIARSLTDFTFCTYLSDLAVDKSFQRQGIGVRLIAETKKYSKPAKLILLAAPAAVDYYPKIGMPKFENCFVLDNLEDLKIPS
ncbi:MAG: GNAT family N-acetyltransferase [Flavitalea sp.]